MPQGARLLGAYQSEQAFGQERLLVKWERVIFPDARSITLPTFTGTDSSGKAGFRDKVNSHFGRIFGGAVMISLVSTAASLSSERQGGFGRENSVRETLSSSLGEQLSSVATEFIRKFSEVEPTLEIRPGYRFNVLVGKDLVFPES